MKLICQSSPNTFILDPNMKTLVEKVMTDSLKITMKSHKDNQYQINFRSVQDMLFYLENFFRNYIIFKHDHDIFSNIKIKKTTDDKPIQDKEKLCHDIIQSLDDDVEYEILMNDFTKEYKLTSICKFKIQYNHNNVQHPIRFIYSSKDLILIYFHIFYCYLNMLNVDDNDKFLIQHYISYLLLYLYFHKKKKSIKILFPDKFTRNQNGKICTSILSCKMNKDNNQYILTIDKSLKPIKVATICKGCYKIIDSKLLKYQKLYHCYDSMYLIEYDKKFVFTSYAFFDKNINDNDKINIQDLIKHIKNQFYRLFKDRYYFACHDNFERSKFKDILTLYVIKYLENNTEKEIFQKCFDKAKFTNISIYKFLVDIFSNNKNNIKMIIKYILLIYILNKIYLNHDLLDKMNHEFILDINDEK